MVQKLLFNNLLHKRKLETSKSVNLASKTCKNGLSKKIRISTPWVIDPCFLTVQVTFFFFILCLRLELYIVKANLSFILYFLSFKTHMES